MKTTKLNVREEIELMVKQEKKRAEMAKKRAAIDIKLIELEFALLEARDSYFKILSNMVTRIICFNNRMPNVT